MEVITITSNVIVTFMCNPRIIIIMRKYRQDVSPALHSFRVKMNSQMLDYRIYFMSLFKMKTSDIFSGRGGAEMVFWLLGILKATQLM